LRLRGIVAQGGDLGQQRLTGAGRPDLMCHGK
jgi:hypothetical protein